jgi:hypothetical protein
MGKHPLDNTSQPVILEAGEPLPHATSFQCSLLTYITLLRRNPKVILSLFAEHIVKGEFEAKRQ